jgi:UDP-N-acetylmuramoyl-tripeptide--D-alanyl-D-alanine ligase
MSEPLWTSEEIVRAVGGRLSGASFEVSGINIDTRALEPGDLFVALAGVRDGHDFLAQAFEKGSAGALVSRPTSDGSCVVVEDDTLRALERLGVASRERASRARRAAVTGSVGKTSVTQAISAAIALAGQAHSSVKSFNNHIGVPLTLARMPRDTRRAVFEIGMNHAGEIEPLSRMVRPHVVVITTVGPVHVENFQDGEVGVARAKAEIFEGLEPGGAAVLNADNPWFEMLAGHARELGATVKSFGQAEGADARLIGFERAEAGGVVVARIRGRTVRFRIAQSGAHWGLNSLATLLALEDLDTSFEVGLEALAAFAPLQGRGAERRIEIGEGAFTLIDESYNANPISMRATLATLGARSVPGRRIAVLTDMLELGPEAPRFHGELAEPIEAAKVDLVFCAGPLMRSLWEGLPASRRGGWAETAEALADEVVDAVRPGDVVMVKGSNGSRASLVVRALAETVRQPAAEAAVAAGGR